MTATRNPLWLLVAVLLAACSSTGSHGPSGTLQTATAPHVPEETWSQPVSAKRATFYRQALPQAARFVEKKFPGNLIRSINKGNERYVVAYDARDQIVGYVRDFSGAISPNDLCPCNPLTVSLVFDADYRFQTLLTPAPLQKYGHAELTPSEHERMLEILRDPPEALTKSPRVEVVVDGTTGATKKTYKEHVVPMAALSTKRLAGLVHDTSRLLRAAPLAVDGRRLNEVLDGNPYPKQRAAALARFIPTADSDQYRVHAWGLMMKHYLEALREGGEPLPDVDDAFMNVEQVFSSEDNPAEDFAYFCYELAKLGAAHRATVQRCEKKASALGASLAQVSRIRGTRIFLNQGPDKAVEDLSDASITYPVESDPGLHHRLARALAAEGKKGQACEIAKNLFQAHPRYPKLEPLFENCRGAAKSIRQSIQKKQRERLLQSQLAAGKRVNVLGLETEDQSPHPLDLRDPKRVTVAVFFATWCPHCQAELPKIKRFASRLNERGLTDKVRVVGIRTAVEKETQPYAAFMQKFDLNFPVWTDATMSLAFGNFVKSQGLPAMLPTLVVIDSRGSVRYHIKNGTYRDTANELMWAVKSLL